MEPVNSKSLKDLIKRKDELDWIIFTSPTTIVSLNKFYPDFLGSLNMTTYSLNNRSLLILNIEHNNLRELPDEILTKNLMILNAGYNNIRKIPDNIINCNSLSTLRLDGNKIWYFPDNLNALTQLKVLDLSNCELQWINPNICSIASLETLYLNYNKIKIIPNAIEGLKNIRQLYLDDNIISEFFWGLTLISDTLRTLSLKNNSNLEFIKHGKSYNQYSWS